MLVAVALLVFGTVAWAGNTFEGFQVVRVIFNGQEVVSDVPAVSFYGRTMLPVRKLAELAGLTVDRWDGETNTVYLSGGAGMTKAVATVNSEPISEQDLYNRMVKESGAAALDTMITERLVAQAARQANITVAPEEVEREIAKIRDSLGGEAQFQQALLQNNITLVQLREYQVFRLQATKLILPSIPQGDDVLGQFFAENKARFDTRQVHARHILVATEQEAKEIKAQLDKGANFAELAKAKSTDPTAKTNGGDLGTFGTGRMVPEFEQVVFSLKAGEISQPFKSAFGWHVAQVLEVKGTAPNFEADKAKIQSAYIDEQAQARLQPYLADLRSKAKITNTLNQK